MKILTVIVPILIAVVLIVVLMAGADNEPEIQTAAPGASEHIYASWDTMEFDKCVSSWMITRFIDKEAEFVLHPSGTEIIEGVVFDVPGAEWSRKHRKCTSDCILEELAIDDIALQRIVGFAHQVELNFWQLDSFPKAQKCFDEVRVIFDSTPDKLRCFEKTGLYFDSLYEGLNKDQPALKQE